MHRSGGEPEENQRPQCAQRNDHRNRQEATTSHVRIDIGCGTIVTASITNEAVADLRLEKGKPAYVVVKASDVMVGID